MKEHGSDGARQARWLADDPAIVPDSTADLLDRRPFVTAVADVLRRAYQPGGSSVFGLIGPWGSGKTSIIGMLEHELTAVGATGVKWHVATFNPWGYGDQVALQWGFFSELRSAMPDSGKWVDAKKIVDTVRRIATPVASAANVAFSGVQGATSAALDLFEGSPTKARKTAEEALRKVSEPILVIIDDLDRLSSSELLEVFKLVRFTGRLPNVYYLLSYDEQTVIDLLGKTDLVGSATDGRALDYLEKIVQVRFDIPPLRQEQVQREFDDGLTGILGTVGIAITDQDRGRLSYSFASALRFKLDTPRSIRRFLGQIEAFLPPVVDEVHWVDFILMSWIRTFEPVLYGLLQPHKDLLLGVDTSYSFDPSAKSAARENAVNGLLTRAGLDPDRDSRTVAALADLFPVVRNAAGRGQYAEQSTERGRINNPDYFDRYFQFGVPADDISDATVSRGLRDLTRGVMSGAVAALEGQLAHATARTLRKVGSERGGGGVDDEAVARWVATQYATVDQNDGTFFNPQTLVESFFADLLLALRGERARIVVAESATDVPTTTLVVTAVSLLKDKQFGGADEIVQSNALGEALTDEAASLARGAVEHAANSASSIFELEADVWRLLWRWDALQPKQVREFFEVRTQSGQWSALDLLSRLIAVSLPVGVQNPVGTLSGVREDLVQRLLDLDSLTQEFLGEVESAGPVPEDFALTDTREHRLAYALAWLRQRRHRLVPPVQREPEA